jgi:hypothetical protein
LTIIGDGERAGHVHHPPSPNRHAHLDAAILHLSGVCAEARVLRQSVASLVLDVAPEDLVAAAKALMAAPPPRKTLAEALALTRALIDERWPQIQLIADALLNSPDGVLTFAEVVELLQEQQRKWEWRAPRFDNEAAA